MVCSFRQTTLDVEIACLDISPLGEGATTSDLVAVGLWTDISARILRLPDLSEATKECLGGGQYKLQTRSFNLFSSPQQICRNNAEIGSDDVFRRPQLSAVRTGRRLHVLLFVEQRNGSAQRQEEGDSGNAANGSAHVQIAEYNERVRLLGSTHCYLFLQSQTCIFKCEHEGSQSHVFFECRSLSGQVTSSFSS